MKKIEFYRAVTVSIPVWVDGKATSEREDRVSMIFKSVAVVLGGLKTQPIYGSCFLDAGVTEADLLEKFAVGDDFTEHVVLLPRDSGFFKAVFK
jgi:hypothetical protein